MIWIGMGVAVWTPPMARKRSSPSVSSCGMAQSPSNIRASRSLSSRSTSRTSISAPVNAIAALPTIHHGSCSRAAIRDISASVGRRPAVKTRSFIAE
jgi:hypothetical protein